MNLAITNLVIFHERYISIYILYIVKLKLLIGDNIYLMERVHLCACRAVARASIEGGGGAYTCILPE